MDDRSVSEVANGSYREMIANGGERDPATRPLLDGVLSVEQARADGLTSLLFVDADEGARNVDGPGGPNDRP